jgi:hypothetical protein
LAASVASYCGAVDRLVVSFDERHLSWNGSAIPVEDCLNQLRRADVGCKIDLRSGHYSATDVHPMENETRQRRDALHAASTGADWVIQLDGDEIVPDLATFVTMIERAETAGAVGLDYPSRWIYARLTDGRFLEGCTRWCRAAASYPGPLAVRADAKLVHARQCDGQLFRVDFRSRNTDPWRDRDHPVDTTVPLAAGVLHFSWVRTLEELNAKAEMSGHRDDADWRARIQRWQRHKRHPWLTTALTPLRRRGDLHPQWLRIVSLPTTPQPRFENPED